MSSAAQAVSRGELDWQRASELSTPCYVFDPAVVIEDWSELKALLRTDLIVSLKACPVLDLMVRCVHALSDGTELASLGELNLSVGRVSGLRYVYSPALDAELAESAVACRAIMVADSVEQINTIVAAAVKRRTAVKVALRLNAKAVLALCGGRMPLADHFGMDVASLCQALDATRGTTVTVHGLHVHAGSNSFAETAETLARGMAEVLRSIRGHEQARIDFVNLGGGFPTQWRELRPQIAHYRSVLDDLFPEVRLLHEAGRAIFSRAGRFVTRIVAVKELGGQRYAVTDGGLAQSFLLAQTERVIKNLAHPSLIGREQLRADAPLAKIIVVGNSCNRADVIGILEGVDPKPGEFLVFDDCGAYHSYSPKSFLSLRPPAHYVVA